jgi:HK97 family phage prohead protease
LAAAGKVKGEQRMNSKGLPVYGKRQVKYGGQNREMLFSALGVDKMNIQKTATGALRVPGLASASSVDRTEEVVQPESFAKHLDVYKRNPLVTFQHDIFYPVGKAVEVDIVENGLAVVDELLYLPTDGLMNYLYAAIEQEVLRTMSIGFIPLKWEDDNTTNIRSYTEVMLVEHAIVSYPANMDAEIGEGVERRSLTDLEDDEGKLVKLAYATGMLAGAIKKEGRALSKDNIDLVEEVLGLLGAAQRNLAALVEAPAPPAEVDTWSDEALNSLSKTVENLKDAVEVTKE